MRVSEIKAVYRAQGFALPGWLKYDPGQKRDRGGRWSRGAGGAAAALPDTYSGVSGWIKQRAASYGSRNEFLASEEYRQAHPHLTALHGEAKKGYAKKAEHAMRSMGVKAGDKLHYDYVTPFGVTPYSGTLTVTKKGQPRVKLDEGQEMMGGGRYAPWHRGWSK